MSTGKVRFAVIGQGYFAQSAVLPAFANAARRCELTAIFSDDQTKLASLKRKHEVEFALHGCILDDSDPEPSGAEGLADVRVIEAIRRAAATGQRVAIEQTEVGARPSGAQEMERPATDDHDLVNARPPHG